ncbi:hypothetical protein LCGC14_2574220 [marine sediment metagenome]|uniref:Uncharacterized protein n=1 Tax=marine sediment metagenome TaxID=412755 RepID=A0A0F9AGQ2_9ZZZZ
MRKNSMTSQFLPDIFRETEDPDDNDLRYNRTVHNEPELTEVEKAVHSLERREGKSDDSDKEPHMGKCILCHINKATVPDRETPWSTRKKICGPCHGKRLESDLRTIIATTTKGRAK